MTFQTSAFNVSESRDYFINPNCYGDDLAKWMIQQLNERSIRTDAEPGQEDFGWYFSFEVAEGWHCCVLGYRQEEKPEESLWIAWIEKARGFLGSILGLRSRGIAPSAIDAIQDVLLKAPEIENIKWHHKKEFQQGREIAGTPDPGAA